MLRATLLALCCTLAAPAAAGGMFELPSGKWRADAGADGDVCLEVIDATRLRLSFKRPDDREPVMVEGAYAVTATKMGDFHFTLTVEKVSQKQLTKCRKAWEVMPLEATERLGARITPGAKLTFTLGYSSCDNVAQLCLHATAEQTAAKAPAVTCATLKNEVQRECREGPPIDGAKINAPALPRR